MKTNNQELKKVDLFEITQFKKKEAQKTLHNTIKIETSNPYKDRAMNFLNKAMAIHSKRV